MKKTMVSLVAAAALTTGAFAADKGIDIVTTGQAVVYYQTQDTDAAGDKGFFNTDNSSANVGVQLDLAADLKNNFTFGAQLTYLGTAGIENTIVGSTRQTATGNVGSGADILHSTTDQIMLTKIFVAKKIDNTTLKIGRQELPKSLSPLAYSESWNVFKNTFDGIVAVNTDLPQTTVVAAFVGNSTGHDLGTVAPLMGNALNDGAYMLTAQNTSLPMTTLTGSYYRVLHLADAFWIDAKVADKSLPMGLTLGAQYGNIDPDAANDTTAYGIKASIKATDAVTLCAAYTSVDDSGVVTVTNLGTGVKSPLYTQMVANQNHIAAIDNDTWMLKGSYSLGDMGTVTAQYADTDDSANNNSDYSELDLIYTVTAGGVDYLAGYVMTEHGNADTDIIRLWARYNF
jgi:hypothetical protein